MKMKIHVNLEQMVDDLGRDVGYVYGENGGYFFTWLPSLEETVGSIESDEVDGDGGLKEKDVAEFLRWYLLKSPKGRNLWVN
jgi:hypothetical protein